MGDAIVADDKSRARAAWVLATFGIDVGGAAGQSAAAAAPGQSASVAVSAPGQSAPAAVGGAATGVVTTAAGKLVYLMSAESKVKSILTIIADDYERSTNLGIELTSGVATLEDWESKYESYDEKSVIEEIGRLTDRTSHEAAGSARGAEIVNEGFMMFVRKLARDLPKVKAQIELAENDIKVHDLNDQIEHIKVIKEGVEKMLDLVTDIVKVAIDPKSESAWIDLGKDLVKDVEDMAFDAQIKPLEEQAAKLTDSSLSKRLALAKQTFADATGDIGDWATFLEKAGHDAGVKTVERDDAYDDETNKKKAGVIRLNDLKLAADAATSLYELAKQAGGVSHSLHSMLDQLEAGDIHSWIGEPATTQKTLNSMLRATKEVYGVADPKVNWSKALEKRFRSFYAAAGNAMADKRVKS